MRRMLMALLVGCGLPVSPAAAQFKTDDPDTEILVQGIRERDQEIASFVKALTFTPVQGTISRFEWEVCPAVLGLTPELNARIANRMRAVASAANIPLAQANCTPNALVLLTRDKPRLLKQLEREAPGIYPDWSVARMRQAIADPSPVAAWQLNGLLSADGSPYSYNYAGYAIHRSSRFPTRIVPGARRQLEVSVVVIDKSALVGLSPTQLADYAAMSVSRAFASDTRPRARSCRGSTSTFPPARAAPSSDHRVPASPPSRGYSTASTIQRRAASGSTTRTLPRSPRPASAQR